MNLFTNWKTTLAGIASVAGGIATIAHALIASPIDPNQITAGATMVATGVGLIFAKDHNT